MAGDDNALDLVGADEALGIPGAGGTEPAPDLVSGQAEPTETDTEQKLFEDAVTRAVEAPEIARVTGDYVSPDDVRDSIEGRRAEIWAAVATPRAQFRDAEQALLTAEESVRKAVLEQDGEANWQRQRAEWKERLKVADEYAKSKARATQRAQEARSTSRAEAMLKDTQSFIDQEQARLFTSDDGGLLGMPVTDAPEPERSGLMREWRRQRRLRRQMGTDPLESLMYEREQAESKLQLVQRSYEVFETAEKRWLEVLEPEIRKAIRQDASCRLARQARDAAREQLGDELFRSGTLPMARAFVNKRAAKLHRTSMKVPEQSGLYDTYTQSLPVVTEAMTKVGDWLSRMKGASIGIAGPRGAGKTTLIELFCSPEGWDDKAAEPPDKFVRLRVSAPVEYVPLEFILYLLGELCRTILRLDSPGDLPAAASLPPAQQQHEGDRRARWYDKPLTRQWVLSAGLCLVALLAVPVLAEIELLGSARFVRDAITVTAVAMVVLVAFFSCAQRPLPLLTPRMNLLLATLWTLLGCAVALRFLRQPPLTADLALVYYPVVLALLGGVVLYGWAGRDVVLVPSPLLAACGAVAAVYAGQRLPTRPSLLIGGCIAIAAAAALSFAVLDDVRWPPPLARYRVPAGDPVPSFADPVLRGSRDILALGALAAFGLSWDPGNVNYAFCVAVGLAVLGGVAAARVISLPAPPGASPASPAGAGGEPPEDDDERSPALQELTRTAAHLLGFVEYAQTLSLDRSLTWSAGLGGQLPLSVAKASTSGSSWARQPWSVPAAVEQFRDLARRVAAQHAGLIVGIDELDKLEYDKSAAFLNDIKAIFGVPRAYFLVSVSENAAAGFERRGVPFRDVFDSSFDEIITVGYLDWPASRELLNQRVVGMHAPFAALCHVFSGGLARDLIRTARAVLSHPDSAGNVSLSDVVKTLCHDEMLGKTHGICRELANMSDDSYAQALLAHVQASDESFETADDYLKWSEYVGGWIRKLAEPSAVDAGKAVRFARELAAFGYFTATVCEFFGEQLSRTRFEKATRASIERLAKARQAMAVSPVVAERYIVEFRGEFPDWKHPHPVSGVTPE